MQKKVLKKFIEEGLGFPVILLNAPMIKVRGQWALHINYNDFQETVLSVLARKTSRLTGSEVQFVRKYFVMTVRGFADRFSVKHPAVLKWERMQDSATHMAWTTEKDIRLFILDELDKKSAEIRDLYRALKEEPREESEPIVINGADLAA